MYDPEFLRNIENSVNLVEYASSSGFDLVKRGNRWWMQCPLHIDKTPSLMIDENNSFHCFSCGIHGQIVSWLRRIEGMSFSDAIQKASRMAGTDISKMCSSETLLFNKNLKVRKGAPMTVPHEIIPESEYKKFKACCPKQWLDEGITEEAMRFFEIRFDAASSRIVYPVRDTSGALIGVKGRSTFSSDECKALGIAKYMNYYEIGTADFLQGLDKTLPYVQDVGEIILFEGIKSTMKAFGWGIKNTAAVESHCINDFQLKLLISLGVDVTVAFDSDVSFDDKANKSLRKALDTLGRFTNVYVVEDKANLLGGADAKKSPVDCGEIVWRQLYSERRRWC